MPSLKSLVMPVLILAFLGSVGLVYIWANVDSLAERFVKQKLNEVLSFGEFVAEVGSANFVPGTGLEIHGLQIIDGRRPKHVLADVHSLTVRFPTDTSSIISGSVAPSSIDVQHLTLHIDRQEFERSLAARIKEVIKNKPPSQLVPIRLRRSCLLVKPSDETPFLKFDNFEADVTPKLIDGKQCVFWVAKANNYHARRMELFGGANLVDGNWQSELKDLQLQIDDELMRWIPIPAQWSPMLTGVAGQVNWQGAIGATGGGEDFEFDIQGKVTNLSVRNSELPDSIEDLTASIHATGDSLEVTNVSATVGAGNVRFDFVQQGLFRPESWRIEGRGERLNFVEPYRRFLNANCQKFCDDYKPYGFFDIDFKLDSSGNREIVSRVTDMSFSFQKFPFRVNGCRGEVRWINDDLVFSMQGLEKGQLLEFSGRVRKPGKHATFVMEFGTQGRLPIDEKAVNALSRYPSIEKALREMRPEGFFKGRGRLVKTRSNSPYIRKEMQIEMHDCNVRHEKFDYPIQEVNGVVRIEDGRFQFSQFDGRSGSASIKCNGTWNHRDGLELVFDCYHVDLNTRLRNALAPSLQEVWDGLRPNGQLHFGRVFLDLPLGASDANIRLQSQLCNPRFQMTHNQVSVFPTWFPYRLENMQGEITVGNGKIALANVLGRHGKTWFSCNGGGTYSENSWNLDLNQMLAGAVAVDEPLLNALPVDLADAVRQLDYGGQLNVTGSIGLSGAQFGATDLNTPLDRLVPVRAGAIHQVNYELDSESVAIDWDLRLDIDQGNMVVGVPLDNIFGSIRLKGRNRGEKFQCEGNVSIDSLTMFDQQVTNVQGPIWIDNQQTQAGKFAKAVSSDASSLSGTLGDGTITFDGWVAHDDHYPFFLQSNAQGFRLEEIAANVAPDLSELSGDGYGFLRLQGQANSLHTYHGDGSLHLRNARIHQLPVVLSLLKILNIKEVNRTAFDSSNVDFSIEGNRMKLDRVELIGDAISLIGNGYLELMRHVDINFYSVVGRNRLYIPVVSEIYKAGSQRIMWISIGGPLGNLQTTRKMLPGLDDSLKKLLGTGETENPTRRGS